MESTNLTNGDTWVERWGAVGLLAFVALAALYLVIRHYLQEKREEKARDERERLAVEQRTEREKQALEKMIDEQRRSLAELNARLVEAVQRSHTETLTLLATQRAEHEEKFTNLLDRHITTSDLAREKTFELASSVTKAIHSLTTKLSPGGRDGRDPS